jgi:hypothetical protein
MDTQPAFDDSQTLPGPVRQQVEDFAALEEIRGPIFGYHVAAYTIQRPEGFYGFAKICRTHPESVWETPDARAIMTVGPMPVAATALDDVFKAVYLRLRKLRWAQPTVVGELPDMPGE